LLERLIPGAWHNSGEIKAEAEEAGHKTRTLKRAFGTLLKEGAGEVKEEGFPRHTYWRIHSGAKGSDETDGPNSGPTGQTRILEPKTPQSAPQWGQTPRLAPLEQKETCECARPARSPRAVGRDFCRTCRRPIAGTE
jgi:hypothetical protein